MCSTTPWACGWPIPIQTGAPAAIWIPTAPARFAHRSWRAAASSTTSCAKRCRRSRAVRHSRGGAGFVRPAPFRLAVQIYEVDQPGTQEWKRRRLTEVGFRFRRVCISSPSTSSAARLAGSVGSQRLRRRTRRGGLVDRRQHVPDSRGDGGHAAPSRGAGAGIDVGDDVHAAAGSGRRGRARDAGIFEQQAAASGTPFINHCSPTRWLICVAPPASRRYATSARTISRSATSPGAPTGYGHPPPNTWSSRRSDRSEMAEGDDTEVHAFAGAVVRELRIVSSDSIVQPLRLRV